LILLSSFMKGRRFFSFFFIHFDFFVSYSPVLVHVSSLTTSIHLFAEPLPTVGPIFFFGITAGTKVSSFAPSSGPPPSSGPLLGRPLFFPLSAILFHAGKQKTKPFHGGPFLARYTSWVRLTPPTFITQDFDGAGLGIASVPPVPCQLCCNDCPFPRWPRFFFPGVPKLPPTPLPFRIVYLCHSSVCVFEDSFP